MAGSTAGTGATTSGGFASATTAGGISAIPFATAANFGPLPAAGSIAAGWTAGWNNGIAGGTAVGCSTGAPVDNVGEIKDAAAERVTARCAAMKGTAAAGGIAAATTGAWTRGSEPAVAGLITATTEGTAAAWYNPAAGSTAAAAWCNAAASDGAPTFETNAGVRDPAIVWDNTGAGGTANARDIAAASEGGDTASAGA